MVEKCLTQVKCSKGDVLVPFMKVCFDGGKSARKYKVPSCTGTLTLSLFSAPAPGSHVVKMDSRLSLNSSELVRGNVVDIL